MGKRKKHINTLLLKAGILFCCYVAIFILIDFGVNQDIKRYEKDWKKFLHKYEQSF